MRLFGWPSDMGACRFYRTVIPFDALRAQGVDARVDESTRLPLDVMSDPERLVVLQRSTNPQAWRVCREFHRAGRPFVFDVDDWLWGLDPTNPAFHHYQGDTVRETLDWLVQHASLVTVSTVPLRNMVEQITDRPVEVIPNTLPLSRITPNLEERTPTVLWRGSPTHDRDIDCAAYALRRADRAGVRVVFAGADYRRRVGARNAVMIDDLLLTDPEWGSVARQHSRMTPQGRKVWLPPDLYLDAVREVVQPTVAVCPLVDSMFNAAKSHIAALEGFAAGAMVVASNVPSFSGFVPDRWLVRNSVRDWCDALDDALSMTVDEWRVEVSAGVTVACERAVDNIVDHIESVYQTVTPV